MVEISLPISLPWVALVVLALLALLGAIFVCLMLLHHRLQKMDPAPLLARMDQMVATMERDERTAREEATCLRQETADHARHLREEIQNSLRHSAETQGQTLDRISSLQQQRLEDFSARLDAVKQAHDTAAATLRQELLTTLKNFQDSLQKHFADSALQLKTHFEANATALHALTESGARKAEELRTSVENRLQQLQKENAAKLEEMRQTVDEKLQGTLEKRLGESFKLVSERLEQVHQGLGDMKNLASGVGDLTRMLTNVKARGVWGEMQLANLLEQILAAEQYATNVRPNPAGKETVEFAIKLPGREDGDKEVWLPIDAKFPREDYERLVLAAERADADAVETAAKALEGRLRSQARDIRDKYLCPPHTTDFGILYLPIEGLYAEALRRPGLAEALQRECRVVLAGPTTLAALLNSLQMGFRSLAIQKRSSEVWKVLGAVKSEFGKFGDILEKVKSKLDETGATLEKAAHRSRQIEKKLRKVEALPADESAPLLLESSSEEETPEDDNSEISSEKDC